MPSKFGFLVKLNILQDIISYFISAIHPTAIHNFGKYLAMVKVFFYTTQKSVQGDYLEFGVFTGSSFLHAMRCHKRTRHFYAENFLETRFYGFDSFEGFGSLKDSDKHPFFTDNNFEVNFADVSKRVNSRP